MALVSAAVSQEESSLLSDISPKMKLTKLRSRLSKLKLFLKNLKYRMTHPNSSWWGKGAGILALSGLIVVTSIWRTWAAAAAWFGGCYLVWWLRNRYVSNILTECAANLEKALDFAERQSKNEQIDTSGLFQLRYTEWGVDDKLGKVLKRLKLMRKLHMYTDPYDVIESLSLILRFSMHYGISFPVGPRPIDFDPGDVIRPTRIDEESRAEAAVHQKINVVLMERDDIRNRLIPTLQRESQRIAS